MSFAQVSVRTLRDVGKDAAVEVMGIGQHATWGATTAASD